MNYGLNHGKLSDPRMKRMSLSQMGGGGGGECSPVTAKV